LCAYVLFFPLSFWDSWPDLGDPRPGIQHLPASIIHYEGSRLRTSSLLGSLQSGSEALSFSFFVVPLVFRRGPAVFSVFKCVVFFFLMIGLPFGLRDTSGGS